MPSETEKQRKFIYYLRGKYKNLDKTPEKFKWVWESGWDNLKEKSLKTILKEEFNKVKNW